MEDKENPVEYNQEPIKVEDMSVKEFHAFLFAVRKNMRDQKQVNKNPSKTTT